MNIDKFIGNEDTKIALTDWLNEFFHSKTNKTKQYAILYGYSGNGKTTLVYALANLFKVDVYRITADDINSKETLNVCKQNLNLQRLDGNLKKIVLVDDLNEFSNKGSIMELHKICNHPIIYTNDSFINDTFGTNGLQFEIKKPLTSQLIQLLKEKQLELKTNCSIEQIDDIARNSISVRSAINSLYTKRKKSIIFPYTNLYGESFQMIHRQLQNDLEYPLLSYFTKKLNCYNEEGYKVLSRFILFDTMITIKFNSNIDKYLINNMREPIHKIKLLNGKNYNKKESKKEPKPIQKKEKTVSKSISEWF